jgi:hypothetical protein
VITDVELERNDLEWRCSAVLGTYLTSLLITAESFAELLGVRWL